MVLKEIFHHKEYTVRVLILAQPNFSGNKRKLIVRTYKGNNELANLLDFLLKFIAVKHISVSMT